MKGKLFFFTAKEFAAQRYQIRSEKREGGQENEKFGDGRCVEDRVGARERRRER
jgi:hypothetical protein